MKQKAKLLEDIINKHKSQCDMNYKFTSSSKIILITSSNNSNYFNYMFFVILIKFCKKHNLIFNSTLSSGVTTITVH